MPFWSRKFPGMVISITMVLFMVFLGLVAVMGVILYRMSMVVSLNLVEEVRKLFWTRKKMHVEKKTMNVSLLGSFPGCKFCI